MVAVANFEARTTKKIVSNIVQQRFDALKARQEADLNARRQKLADKLDLEDLALRQELLASKKTPEQRRSELAARARALAAKREAERQQLAASLYEKAFIQSCDVLRVENTKRILYRTLEERNAQVFDSLFPMTLVRVWSSTGTRHPRSWRIFPGRAQACLTRVQTKGILIITYYPHRLSSVWPLG